MASRADRSDKFKNGVDSNESRRRREESGVSVRKNKREEGLTKRRQMASSATAEAGNGSTAFTPPPVVAADGSVVSLIPGGELSTGPFADLAQQKTFTAKDIPKLNEAIRSTDAAAVLAATKGFRRVLSIEPNPPVLEVLAVEVLPLLIHLLGAHDHQELQFEAAWALTNIASTDQTRRVVDAGAVSPMAQLLLSPNPDVREQCAWCLGNVAGDGPELRNFVLSCGALQPLLQNLLQPASMSMLRNGVWAVSNMCRGKPQPELSAVAPAIPVIAQLLATSEDKEVLMDASWALSYLSDGENERVAAVVATGVVPRLITLLAHCHASVVTPALRTLGNIVSGDDAQTQSVVDSGGLAAVKPLLNHVKKGLRKEACWALSNVAAGSSGQISSLLQDSALVDSVLERLSSDEWDVRKEAAWVVSNVATGGTHEQVFALVKNHGVVEPLCLLLDVQDSKVLLVALDALDSLLKCDAKASGLLQVPALVDEAGGLDKLEALQEHENQNVYTKSVALIETYFGAEEDDDEDDREDWAPSLAKGGNAFAFGVPPPTADTAALVAASMASMPGGGSLTLPPPPTAAVPQFGVTGVPPAMTAGGVVPPAGSSGFNFNFTPGF